MQIYIKFHKKCIKLYTFVLNFIKFYEKYTKFHVHVHKFIFQLQIY